MTAPSLAAPNLTPPQMVTPNLQQFFPQATRQSLLGPPPVGVPMNPSQLSHSGRNSQKQARTSSSSTPNCKVSRALGGAAGVGVGEGVPQCQPGSLCLGSPGLWAGHAPSLCLSVLVCKMKAELSSLSQTSNTSMSLMGL